MKHQKIWIVVADGGRAQFFCNNGPGSGLEPALSQALVADNRPSRDIASDRPGRTFNSVGKGRHSVQPSTDPHEYEQELFARAIAKLLAKKCVQKEFDKIILIAAPKMLGALRFALDPITSRLVIGEIDKNLTKFPPGDLAQYLGEFIKL